MIMALYKIISNEKHVFPETVQSKPLAANFTVKKKSDFLDSVQCSEKSMDPIATNSIYHVLPMLY